MNTTIERTALTQLVTNEQYARKVLPFIKKDYFSDKTERTVFEEINKFVDKYNKIPTQTSLEIEVSSRRDLNQTEYDKVIEVIKTLKSTDFTILSQPQPLMNPNRNLSKLTKVPKSHFLSIFRVKSENF